MTPRLKIVWWTALVECGSAVHRLRREGAFAPVEAAQLLTRLTTALGAAEVVQPGEELSATALRLLATHPLRAADALQLAAALVFGPAAAPMAGSSCASTSGWARPRFSRGSRSCRPRPDAGLPDGHDAGANEARYPSHTDARLPCSRPVDPW